MGTGITLQAGQPAGVSKDLSLQNNFLLFPSLYLRFRGETLQSAQEDVGKRKVSKES